jgi:hypothetical protein
VKTLSIIAVCLVTAGCAGKRLDPPRPVDPVAVANGVAGALIVAEQVQAIEASLYHADAEPDREAHCRIQRTFGLIGRQGENALAIVFNLEYPNEDRAAALRALVDGAGSALALVAPKLSDQEQIALRAALAVGTVVVMRLSAERMPMSAPPQVLQLRDSAVAGLRRMRALAVAECPEASALAF